MGWSLATQLTAVALLVAAHLPFVSCGTSDTRSPFAAAGGSGGAGGQGGGSNFNAGGGGDRLGGLCTEDSQCDDLLDCTFDACDQQLGRCRFSPDDSVCQNAIHCDGMERCSATLGCIAGEPISCSDGNPCTINSCNESSKSCTSAMRDVDGDGDGDIHCGGGDCDDTNPQVSSLLPEVCANSLDDNCNGEVDEAACQSPQHDDCLDPLAVAAPGTYPMQSAAAKLDYAASCTVVNPVNVRDVVAAIQVPAGTHDVQLTLRSPQVDVALALMGQCAQAASELGCSPGFVHPAGGRVAKVRARSLGPSPAAVTLPAYIFSETASDLTLRYELLPASSKPANETCASAQVLEPLMPQTASVVDANPDVASACAPATGELLYRFTLDDAADVELYANSLDGDGYPVLSLRQENCALPGDEITCHAGSQGLPARIYRHALAAGTYYVAVAATAPSDIQLTLTVSGATMPPADEDCQSAPLLEANKTINVLLANHQDDVHMGCLVGATDAAYRLELSEPSDVLLLGRYSSGDKAAAVLAKPACATANDQLACGTSTTSPSRGRARNLKAGSYRVLAESKNAQPMQLTALVRKAVPPTLVPFADGCTDALTVATGGGFFQGNTSNAQSDFDAGCDQSGQPAGGARDQMLRLVLPSKKRVVLDMQGSGYATLLNVLEDNGSCPGLALPKACAAGYYAERSFLDLELPAASYYIQVDGYAGASGPWFLDVYVVDP